MKPLPLLGLLMMLTWTEGAAAHGLGVQCRPRGEQVEVEAYFSDNTPARAATVRVTDGEGAVVAEGLTDGDGRWRFPKPTAGRYQVTVDAGAGHVTRVALSSQLVSEGPSREEFTAFPWLKITIGVVALIGFSAAFWFARRQKATSPSERRG